ncbi:MAG: uroporphyrinogen-III synthase [Thermoanaerobaculia bacterium]|nr:uroporphyrinogen-III synthase [Thermoanaerobaculia bacterium]
MRILLLRSGAAGSEDAPPGDVTVLHTHAVTPRAEGIAEALAFDTDGATLVVSSKETISFLLPLFRSRFGQMLAVGEGTAALLRRVITGGSDPGRRAGTSTSSGADAASIVVPGIPGAAGVIHFLRESPAAAGMRILWPHGSDAAPEPFEEIRRLGISLVAPVVYEKRPFARSEMNPSILSDFRAGRFAAVAVGSTAGLDGLLAALDVPAASLPPLRWGVLGPETAKAVTARGLPPPLVPAHARLSELLDLLRKEIR